MRIEFISHFAVSVVLVALAGCSSATVLYGAKSCGDEAAYPTANGAAAICLPKDRVAYLLCARELGLSTTTHETSRSEVGSLKVPSIGEVALTHEQKEKLAQAWASEGDLASARAQAIRACIGMLPPDERPAPTPCTPAPSPTAPVVTPPPQQ